MEKAYSFRQLPQGEWNSVPEAPGKPLTQMQGDSCLPSSLQVYLASWSCILSISTRAGKRWCRVDGSCRSSALSSSRCSRGTEDGILQCLQTPGQGGCWGAYDRGNITDNGQEAQTIEEWGTVLPAGGLRWQMWTNFSWDYQYPEALLRSKAIARLIGDATLSRKSLWWQIRVMANQGDSCIGLQVIQSLLFSGLDKWRFILLI